LPSALADGTLSFNEYQALAESQMKISIILFALAKAVRNYFIQYKFG
jgi:hypothetical protein